MLQAATLQSQNRDHGFGIENRAVDHHFIGLVHRDQSDVGTRRFRPDLLTRHRLETGGKEYRGVLGGIARRIHEPGELREFVGVESGFLGQLALGHIGRAFGRIVGVPSRNLQCPPMVGNTVLLNQRNHAVFGDGQHSDGVAVVFLDKIAFKRADLIRFVRDMIDIEIMRFRDLPAGNLLDRRRTPRVKLAVGLVAHMPS